MFLVGLVGFATVSALGGASVNFAMLVTARACQGTFAALLVPAALSLLTTTFTDPRDRAKAFGVYGAIATAGGAVGLMLGGALTEYLSWRWCLYVNLLFAAVAFIGGMRLLNRQAAPSTAVVDWPGVVLASGGMFCLVYGFSNAATHGWHTPSTWGFLVAGLALLLVFACWMGRAPHPLLPPRVVLNRNRGAAYLSMMVASLCLFATLLFLTYYMQRTLGYSPLVTGFAFLPISVGLAGAANLSTIVLMPRVGPKPIVTVGLLRRRGGDGLACPARSAYGLRLGPARSDHRCRIRSGNRGCTINQRRHVRRSAPGRRSCIGHRHGRSATRCLHRHLAAQHHLRKCRCRLSRGP